MTTATPTFGTIVTHTISGASLASDANLLAGRQGTAIDQIGTDDALDALVGGLVTLGTSPTTAKQIEFWAYGSFDGGTTYNDAITGTDGNVTLINKNSLRLLCVIPTLATSNQAYRWGPYSIAQAFGGFVPSKWGIFVVHNTGVALNSTAGNFAVKHYPIKVASV
jgi:hypothetical protein